MAVPGAASVAAHSPSKYIHIYELGIVLPSSTVASPAGHVLWKVSFLGMRGCKAEAVV